MKKKVSSKDVADWMLQELGKSGELYQEEAVYAIAKRFGDDFIYENESGNPAISKAVLDAFRKLTGDEVVWVRSDRYWRRREKWDDPGRMQT